jgi:membrane associated rhomboid family serine protease
MAAVVWLFSALSGVHLHVPSWRLFALGLQYVDALDVWLYGGEGVGAKAFFILLPVLRSWLFVVPFFHPKLPTRADGAIYGVLIAFAYLYPDLEMQLLFPPIPIKAKYLALGLLALDILRGFGGSQSQTAHFAHAGGAFFGFLLLLFWYKGRTRV